jgi:RHS repeat-associated protein
MLLKIMSMGTRLIVEQPAMIIIKKRNAMKLLLSLTFMFLYAELIGQSLTGTISVKAGLSYNYNFSDDQYYPDASWEATNGDVKSNSFSYTNPVMKGKASVVWTSPGLGQVRVVTGSGALIVSLDVVVAEGPVDAGPDRSICKEAGTIDLSSWGLSLSTGSWSGPAGSIVNGAIQLSALSIGRHTFIYTRTSDNTSDSMVLTVDAPSVAGPLTFQPDCGVFTGTIVMSTAGTIGSIAHWQRSQNNGTTWTTISSTLNPYTYSESVPTLFRAGVKNGSCSINYSAPVMAEFISLTVGQVKSNAIITCTSVTGSLSVIGSNGTVHAWERSYDNGNTWLAFLLPLNETRKGQFRARMNTYSCYGYTPPITLEPLQPVGGFLSANTEQLACGRATGNLSLQNYTGDTFTWQSSIDGGSSWGTLAGASGTTYSFNVVLRTQFRVLVGKSADPTCTAAVSTQYVARIASQGGSATTANNTQCGTATGYIDLAGYLGNIVQWEYSADQTNWTAIANSTSKSQLPFTTIQPVNYYRALVQLDGCASVYSSSAIVNVTPVTNPGKVRLVGERQTGEYINGNLVFYPDFVLQDPVVGQVQNWRGQTETVTNTYGNTTKSFSTTLTQTTAFDVLVSNGVCGPLYSGKAIFVVNKKSEGVKQLVVGTELSEYEGFSYQVKTADAISLKDGFSFFANSQQDFFVLIDDNYSLPPADQNYVLQETILKEGIIGLDDVYFLNAYERASSYTYFDGLGRPMQQVQRRASPTEKDMVTPITYDAVGRQDKDYLPYMADATDGHYKKDAVAGQAAFYLAPPEKVAASDYPYSVKVFEPSPLNRVLQQGAPGTDWQPVIGHTVKFDYEVNTTDDKVKLWTMDAATGLPVTSGFHDRGQLYVNVTVDEHGSSVKEYKDKLGLVVLKRVQDGTEWLETYYIFDDFNLLRYTLQPEGAATLTGNPDQTFLNTWAFQYRYDERKRLVEKRVPGASWAYMVYDKRDRLVLTQDGNLRGKNQWTFTKYDALNRPLVSGLYTHATPLTQQEMADKVSKDLFVESFDGSPAFYGYTNTVFPTENIEVLSITYYDNYDFRDLLTGPFAYDPRALEGMDATAFDRVKGLVTGGKTRILNTATWLASVTYYDKRYRAIQTVSQNQLGGQGRTSQRYDFAGKVLARSTIHTKNSSPDITVGEIFDYDHAGRLLAQYHQVGNGPKVNLKAQRYNAIGQLVEKNLHAVPEGYLQSVDYRYNVRGWLTHINNAALVNDGGVTNDEANDYFGFELKYNNSLLTGSTAQFNGNISEALWKNVGNGGQAYSYSYDPLNRLKQSSYVDLANPLNNDRFNETITGYDGNGNIRGLQRQKNVTGLMDDLVYTYLGNQLLRVTDSGNKAEGFKEGANTNDDYAYDDNGNMNTDMNKGIGITYNYLNLAESVTRSATENMQYVYSATGAKLSQTVNENGQVKTTDYVGSFVYENGALQFILHDEGRINMATATPAYEYFLKDHLGNVRTSFTSAPQTETHTATMEAEDTEEDQVFIKFGNTRVPTIEVINHTPLAQTGPTPEVVRLNGHYQVNEGPGQSIAVMPGDKIHAEVYVKYLDLRRDNGIPATALLNYFATGLGGFTTTAIDGGLVQVTDNINAGLSALFGNGTESGYGPPSAYLNCFFFDKDNSPSTVKFAWAKVDGSAAITPLTIGNAHQLLSLDLEFTAPGHVYINLSHDADENVDVYYDDLTITHTKSPLLEQTNYYSFGLVSENFVRDNVLEQKYRYNGKEVQKFTGWLDYGARMYDSEIGRWKVQDRKAEFYFATSAYAYALNQPTNAIDPDGNLVIFINGNHFGFSAPGASYWQTTQSVQSYNSYSFAGQHLWSGMERHDEARSFDGEVMNQLGDHNARYYDGSNGGWHPFVAMSEGANTAGGRVRLGYEQGQKDAETIVANLARDKSGNIVETIKIVTHSMGGAYGKGLVKALKEYIKTLPIEQQKQILISLVADFDPYQAGDLTADPDIKTMQRNHKNGWNVLGMGWLGGNEDQEGNVDSKTNTGTSTDHAVVTFFNDIRELSEGTYKWDGSKWVKQ